MHKQLGQWPNIYDVAAGAVSSLGKQFFSEDKNFFNLLFLRRNGKNLEALESYQIFMNFLKHSME